MRQIGQLKRYFNPLFRYATVTVLVPPEPPRIRSPSLGSDGVLRAVEGREMTAECVSEGGKPASEVGLVFFYALFSLENDRSKLGISRHLRRVTFNAILVAKKHSTLLKRRNL